MNCIQNTSDLTPLASNMTQSLRYNYNSELGYYNPSMSSYYEVYRLKGFIFYDILSEIFSIFCLNLFIPIKLFRIIIRA